MSRRKRPPLSSLMPNRLALSGDQYRLLWTGTGLLSHVQIIATAASAVKTETYQRPPLLFMPDLLDCTAPDRGPLWRPIKRWLAG